VILHIFHAAKNIGAAWVTERVSAPCLPGCACVLAPRSNVPVFLRRAPLVLRSNVPVFLRRAQIVLRPSMSVLLP
jgi:hypothetical protein